MKRRDWLTLGAAAPFAPLLLQGQQQRTILLRTAWQARNIGDVCFAPQCFRRPPCRRPTRANPQDY